MTGPRPHWRSYLRAWGDDHGQRDRTQIVEAALEAGRARAGHRPGPASGRLANLRGPIRWLSIPPAQQTADGSIVARFRRRSWGRDGAWLRFPMCRAGLGHWTVEEWIPARGWVRLLVPMPSWPRKVHAVLPGMDPLWRRCGVEDLASPIVATRHIRAVLVHWLPYETEVRAGGLTAADLLPLLDSPEAGVRMGALQALVWAAGDRHSQQPGEQQGEQPGEQTGGESRIGGVPGGSDGGGDR